jgi:ankyrin repeat protein
MTQPTVDSLINEFVEGRTDLVFELVARGQSPNATDKDGVSFLRWCAYYGDVSAMRFLLANGASLDSLGQNLGLDAAAFHGHWRLCKFLLEQGANVNQADAENGQTALHAALCKTDRVLYDRVLKVLLMHGANPNVATKNGAETGSFMRDCRTKGETPLHRAAAFGDEGTIKLLLDAGAKIDAKDANGDTPLSWASWYLRPNSILRLLLYGNFRIRPDNQSMQANLLGTPQAESNE